MIRRITTTTLLLLAGAAMTMLWREESRPPAKTKPEIDAKPEIGIQRLKILAGKLEHLQQPLCKPEPGDWLQEHKEDGQTFAEFLQVRPDPINKDLVTFYLLPIGSFTKTQEKLLAATGRGLELSYDRQVTFLTPISIDAIPIHARRISSQTKKLQILSTYVLDEVLKPARPKDAIAVLALSAADLWPGKGWNFVFGQASLSERVGVWSIARFGDPDKSAEDYTRCLDRMSGTALHESGHMLGIHHCKAWNCCMNGSNNLEEGDRHPLWFCAECQPKVWWACGMDPKLQSASLARFAEQLDLKAATEHWKSVEKMIP